MTCETFAVIHVVFQAKNKETVKQTNKETRRTLKEASHRIPVERGARPPIPTAYFSSLVVAGGSTSETRLGEVAEKSWVYVIAINKDA